VDAKASPKFKESVESLVQIFRKTFPHTTLIVANPTRRIYWSDVSILEAGNSNITSRIYREGVKDFEKAIQKHNIRQ